MNSSCRASPSLERSYARGFVAILFEAVEYCFGSILPVQDQVHGGLASLHRRKGVLTSRWEVPVSPHSLYLMKHIIKVSAFCCECSTFYSNLSCH